MKILIITPRIPYPPHRGDNLHAYNIAKQLTVNNEVDIATQIKNDKQFEFVERLKNESINTYISKLPIIKSIWNLFLSLFSQRPFQVAFFSNKNFAKLIEQLVQKNEYDLIYFHLVRSVQYLPATQSSDSIKVIDLTDAVSLYLERYLKFVQNPFRKIFFSIEQKRIYKYEKNAGSFDTVFICSEVDREHLKQNIPDDKIKILRNGVNESFFSKSEMEYVKRRIIFSGNMPYYPNRDATLFFANEIFPKVLDNYPDSKFYIVGQKPSLKIKRLASENVFVTGFVDDIKKEYLLSEVNVAPIRFGAGTPNKVLESLALGVPVVATDIAIGGLPNELKKYVLIANNVDEFRKKITFIFENKNYRTEIMKECSELVPKILGWKNIVSDFETYIRIKIQNE